MTSFDMPGAAGRVRALVLTNHFNAYAGSEIVALEVAEWFAAQGDAVTLASNLIGPPVADEVEGFTLTGGVECLTLSDFDVVWCQHDLLTLLPLEAWTALADRRLPLAALVSLSPFEPYEHVDGLIAEALGAEIFANSPETADEVARRNPGKIDRAAIRVFHNAAPPAYFAPRPPLSPSLRRILIVSNHVPEELTQAIALMRGRGVEVSMIGAEGERRRVTPADLAAADAVITIGKTAVYALASGTPVYLYDHFGGDGWLNAANAGINAHHNFSGRPARRRLTATAILRELFEGYSAAAASAAHLGAGFPRNAFSLDHHLQALRQRALTRPPGASWSLGWWLTQPGFRTHLEAAHWKSMALRRAFAAAHR